MIVIHAKKNYTKLDNKLDELREFHSITTIRDNVMKELNFIRYTVHRWALMSDNDPATTGMDLPTGFIPDKLGDFFFNTPDLVKWQTLFTKTPVKKAYGFSNSFIARILMRRIGLITGKLKDIFKMEIIGGERNDFSG